MRHITLAPVPAFQKPPLVSHRTDDGGRDLSLLRQMAPDMLISSQRTHTTFWPFRISFAMIDESRPDTSRWMVRDPLISYLADR